MATKERDAQPDPKRDWRKAQDAIDTLVRLQIAQGLAPLFFKRNRPYEENAELAAMMDDRLLHKAAFIQKPPFLLKFYRRLLFARVRAPRSIIEIGVKGGGSTALWKALFPDATVVGLDLELRRWLTGTPAPDGVVYVEGDQSDVPLLESLARQYGPFDLVIDDGSHLVEDQEITLRALLPHVEPGGDYVIEDVHAAAKLLRGGARDDFWGAFVTAVFAFHRNVDVSGDTPGARLALDLARRIDDLIVARRLLALRVGG